MVVSFVNALKDEFQILFSGKSPYHKMAFLIVLIVTTVFSLSFSNRYINEGKIAVLDFDNSRYSREFIGKLDASPYVNVQTIINSVMQPETLFYNGKHLAVVYIPKGFEKNHYAGSVSGNKIGVFYDNTNMMQSGKIHEALNGIIANENTKGKSTAFTISVSRRDLFNPLGSYTNTMGLGLALFFSGIFFTQSIIGMIPRLRMENKWDNELKNGNPLATISRLIPYIIIYLMGNTFVLAILRLTNDMSLNGSFLLFVVAVLIQGFALRIVAMFVGWSSPTPVAAGRFLLLVCTPGYIFGGVLLPPDYFPQWVQVFTNIFPLKWLFLFMRDVLLRGTNFLDCAANYGDFLIYLSVALILFCLRFFRERSAIVSVND